MRRAVSILTICFMILFLFSGCGILERLGLFGGDDNDELSPASSIVMNEEEAGKISDKVPVHLYFIGEDPSKLNLEVRYVPLEEAKKSVNNLASIIVKELIKGPGAESALKPVIPAGTQLRSPITINAGVATVDFSKEFQENHPGGSVAERLTIFSVVNSLTELKEIQKVKFTIEGKTVTNYKGNFQFDAPFPRSASIISKDAPPVNTSTSTETAKEATKEKTNTAPTTTQTETKPGTTKPDATKPDTTKPDTTAKPDDKSTPSSSDEVQETVAPEEEDEATYLEILE